MSGALAGCGRNGPQTSAPTTTGAVPGSGGDFTADDLRRLADTYAAASQGGGQAVIHALFLHGTFQGDTSYLGVAVRGDVLAVFEDQVQGAGSPLVSSATIEDA